MSVYIQEMVRCSMEERNRFRQVEGKVEDNELETFRAKTDKGRYIGGSCLNFWGGLILKVRTFKILI
jgi:hypothetical protein